jgi:DMSO/TMAO reductase YedYZ heme-binding membrane subunit
MKYRGLDPRTRPLRWALFLAGVTVVLAATLGGTTSTVIDWLTSEQDRLPWYTTRVLALLAYAALTASVVYGLLLSTGVLDAIAHRTVSFTLHQDLSSIGLSLALMHAVVLTLDRSVPFSIVQLAVPFLGPYRPLWTGIGQLTLILTAVVVGSFHIRRRIGQPRWRGLHYLTYLVFLGATVHGLMAGTDTSTPWAFWGYVAASATVVFLTAYRVTVALVARRGTASA